MATSEGSDEATATPPELRDFERAQRRLLETTGTEYESQFVELQRPACRIHAIDAGDPDVEPPVLLIHGVTGFGAMFAPLLAGLDGRRVIAVDRPGWGLSGEYTYAPDTHRQTAVEVLSGVLDELGVERVDIVGHSTGGYWGILFALAHPDRVRRVVLVGGVPSFPGTRPPIPARLFTLSPISRFVFGRLATSRDGLVKQMKSVGERDTIIRYPELIQAWVESYRLRRTPTVACSEYRAFVTLRGWRANRIHRSELRDLRQPTAFIWGERDFLGSPSAVREPIDAMPAASLEVLDAGHIPWFGHPESRARLVQEPP
ncbi:MAG: alpha/beta hydrolase [Halobacteriales archaeon]|nr:alpha/beta hydrolase [Halobacteriales archaeon]